MQPFIQLIKGFVTIWEKHVTFFGRPAQNLTNYAAYSLSRRTYQFIVVPRNQQQFLRNATTAFQQLTATPDY